MELPGTFQKLPPINSIGWRSVAHGGCGKVLESARTSAKLKGDGSGIVGHRKGTKNDELLQHAFYS